LRVGGERESFVLRMLGERVLRGNGGVAEEKVEGIYPSRICLRNLLIRVWRRGYV